MKPHKKKVWTEEENQILIDNFPAKRYVEIQPLMPYRSVDCLRAQGKKLGLKWEGKRYKYSKNESFWSIPNLINCYFGGFCSSDASVGKYELKSGYTSRFALELSIKDKDHVQLFKEVSGYTGPLSYYWTKGSNGKLYESCKLSIANASLWLKDLENNFSVTQAKTYNLKPPNTKVLSTELLKYFLIGCIDGDGFICVGERGGCPTLSVGVTGASREFLEWIEGFIKTEYKLPWDSDRHLSKGTSKCLIYQISGFYAAIVVDALSKLPCECRLKRKWEQDGLKEAIDYFKSKEPELFTNLKGCDPKNYQHFIKNEWTPEEEDYMLSQLNKKPYSAMAQDLGRSLGSITNHAQQLRLISDFKFGKRRRSFDENFWNDVNDTNSFFAGYLFGAATLFIVPKQINLAIKTPLAKEPLLQAFVTAIKTNAPIIHFQEKDKWSGHKKFDLCSLKDNWLIPLRTNFGYGPNKQTLTQIAPLLTEKSHILNFIYGLICGNGKIEDTIKLRHKNKNVIDYVADFLAKIHQSQIKIKMATNDKAFYTLLIDDPNLAKDLHNLEINNFLK